MANSKRCLLAVLVAGAICLSYAIPDPTVEMNDAKDKILQSAATATSKSRFPAGRSLLQDTAEMNDAKDKVLQVAASATAKSRFPAGRSLLQEPTALLNDAKDKVLQKAAAVVAESRFPAGRSLLGEGKSDVDRAALNVLKISEGSSKVADAAQRITMAIGNRNWVTRRLLQGGTNHNNVDRMTLTAVKVDEEISKVEDAFSNIKIQTDRTMRTQGRQLLKADKAEIPDTATVADKINLAVYDMGFDTHVKVSNQGRQLLQARAGDVPTTVPGPKVIYSNTEQVAAIDKNKAKIDGGAQTVSSLFDKIAARAGFRA